MNKSETYEVAIKNAKKFAKAGPRVAAVLQRMGEKGVEYKSAPGYMDADNDEIQQIALVTPDGRVWLSQKGGAK